MNSNFRMASIALVSACFVLSVADMAPAQPPRFNRKLFGTIPAENLARLEVVQKSLAISDDQKKKIAELNANRNTEQQEQFQSAPQGDFEAFGKIIAKLDATYLAKLNAVLDEKQQKRMMEIYLQVNSGLVLVDAPVAKMLKITEEQVKKLNQAIVDNRNEAFGSFASFQDKTEEERLKAQDEMVKAREKLLLAALTDDQRKEFDKAKGEILEIDLDKLPPFGQ